MLRLILLILLGLLSGCASITTGQDQSVSINTPDCPQAECQLTNKDGTFYISSTPGTVMVDKACSELTIKCSKPGYPDHVTQVGSALQPMTLGNVIFGGLIGIGVDAATGAACKYPSLIPVAMDCGAGEELAGNAENVEIPGFVLEAADEAECSEPVYVGTGEDGADVYSAKCGDVDTLMNCAGEECTLSEYRVGAGGALGAAGSEATQ